MLNGISSIKKKVKACDTHRFVDFSVYTAVLHPLYRRSLKMRLIVFTFLT